MIIKFVKIVWVPPGCKKHPTGDSSSTQFYWKITFLPKRAYFDFKKTCFFVFLGCGIVRFIRVTFLSNPSIPTSREIQLPLQKGDRKHTHLFKAPLIKGEGGDLSHKWELPLLHPPWERGGKGGIWATSGNCHCFTPLEKGGKKGGFEPQVGIAIASQPPLRKGGKGGFEPQVGKGDRGIFYILPSYCRREFEFAPTLFLFYYFNILSFHHFIVSKVHTA